MFECITFLAALAGLEFEFLQLLFDAACGAALSLQVPLAGVPFFLQLAAARFPCGELCCFGFEGQVLFGQGGGRLEDIAFPRGGALFEFIDGLLRLVDRRRALLAILVESCELGAQRFEPFFVPCSFDLRRLPTLVGGLPFPFKLLASIAGPFKCRGDCSFLHSRVVGQSGRPMELDQHRPGRRDRPLQGLLKFAALPSVAGEPVFQCQQGDSFIGDLFAQFGRPLLLRCALSSPFVDPLFESFDFLLGHVDLVLHGDQSTLQRPQFAAAGNDAIGGGGGAERDGAVRGHPFAVARDQFEGESMPVPQNGRLVVGNDIGIAQQGVSEACQIVGHVDELRQIGRGATGGGKGIGNGPHGGRESVQGQEMNTAGQAAANPPPGMQIGAGAEHDGRAEGPQDEVDEGGDIERGVDQFAQDAADVGQRTAARPLGPAQHLAGPRTDPLAATLQLVQ